MDLEGNYSSCNDEYYTEVYFKNGSIRFANDNEWIRLSEWKKYKFENDSLYFESVGEHRDAVAARILKVNNSLEFYTNLNDDKITFNPINENLELEDTEKFWINFSKRKEAANCKSN